MKKKLLIVISLAIACIALNKVMIPVASADSGWDTSYDSGGSWDSGSDWNYDYGSDDSSDRPLNLFEEIILYTFIGASIVIFLYSVITHFINIVRNLSYKIKNKSLFKLKAKVKKEKIDNSDYKRETFKIFKEVQIAWMNFDYDALKELVSDELYNMYVSELEMLKVNGQKNMMESIHLEKCHINKVSELHEKLTIEVIMAVSFKDYVINTTKNKVVRGDKHKIYHNEYKLVFTKEKELKQTVCPSCGAEVKGNVSGVCEYCRAKLVHEAHDWVMISKEKINQR